MYLSILMVGSLSVLGSRDAAKPSQDKARVKCEIWVSSTQVPGSQATLLHVLIQNSTPHEAIIRGIEVHLTDKNPQEHVVSGSQGSYWAWVDPETKSALKTSFDPKEGLTHPQRKVALSAEKELDFSLDLEQLQWEGELSSGLPPSAPLHAIVLPGTYEVALSINGEWNTSPLSINSNKVSMEIHKQARKVQ